jgi:hypothetical protein
MAAMSESAHEQIGRLLRDRAIPASYRITRHTRYEEVDGQTRTRQRTDVFEGSGRWRYWCMQESGLLQDARQDAPRVHERLEVKEADGRILVFETGLPSRRIDTGSGASGSAPHSGGGHPLGYVFMPGRSAAIELTADQGRTRIVYSEHRSSGLKRHTLVLDQRGVLLDELVEGPSPGVSQRSWTPVADFSPTFDEEHFERIRARLSASAQQDQASQARRGAFSAGAMVVGGLAPLALGMVMHRRRLLASSGESGVPAADAGVAGAAAHSIAMGPEMLKALAVMGGATLILAALLWSASQGLASMILLAITWPLVSWLPMGADIAATSLSCLLLSSVGCGLGYALLRR